MGTTMKNCIMLLLGLALLSNHSFSESKGSERSPAKNSEVTHVVMVWLKQDISNEQRDLIMSSAQQLVDIPGVTHVRSGLPIASERSIVDDSFSFGITINLTSAAHINTYLQHPLHVNYVDTHIKGKARKLLIYDF